MAWLELHTVLIRHRKTKRFARELKIDPVLAVGHLTTLWGNVLELAESGDITKWSIEDISDYSEWKKDPKMFYQALKNGGDGFIDEKNGLVLIHDWWDYAGRYLKAKYKSHNPDKLHQIMMLYGKTKEQPRSDNGELSNQSINLTNQSNQSDQKPVCMDDVHKIINTYKQKKGLDIIPKTAWGRFVNVAKKLIIECGLENTLKALDFISEDYKKKKLDWTLETVLNKFPELLAKGENEFVPDTLKEFDK